MTSHLRIDRTVAAAGLAVLAALGAGCGGSSGAAPAAATTASTTTAASRTAADAALFTYAACMRGKGVAIPDPVRGANGRYAFPAIPASVTNAPGVRAKAQACAAQLPQGSFRRGGAPSSAQRAAFQKFSACMQKNGVTFGRPGDGQGTPPAGQTTTPNGPRGGGFPVVPGQRPQGSGQRRQGRGGFGFFNSSDPKVKAALAKCQSLLPAAFGRGGPPTRTQTTP
jgi:hypothetical protein